MTLDCLTRSQSSRTVAGGPEGATEVPQATQAPAQGDDRIRVPNNYRWLIQPSHSRASAHGQPRSGYGIPRVAHKKKKRRRYCDCVLQPVAARTDSPPLGMKRFAGRLRRHGLVVVERPAVLRAEEQRQSVVRSRPFRAVLVDWFIDKHFSSPPA